MTMLKAGIQRKDITPPKGLELAGYPHYPRYNEGAHDPLYAVCMYMDNGKEEIAMVTLDLLFMSKLHVAKIRKNVEKLCGIKGSNVMISCSHTHSGPWTSGRLDLEDLINEAKQPMEYVNWVIDELTELIINAKKEAFDAYFTSGTAMCGAEVGVGGNRRYPGGPHDPLVSVMAIKDTNDKVRGMLTNYTLHPTFIHEWSNVCTADYPCYLKLEIQDHIPDVIVGFSQGTSGNQSSRYYRQGESYDEAERVGRILGKAAYSVLEKAQWKNDFEIKVAGDSLELELKQFESEESLRARVAHDKAVYEDLYKKYGNSTNRDEYYLWQNANLKCLGSEDALGYVLMMKEGKKIEVLDDEGPAEIQIFRIGDTCVIGLQGEIFVEYGLFLKAMAGFDKVIVNELSNGDLPGYLCTPESTVEGGYEVDTSMLDVKFGMHYIQKTIDTIEKVK